MRYRSTRQLVDDLRKNGRLLDIDDTVDGHLELAEIHRRVYRSGGPALLFNQVQGCSFPVATNLFGTIERARFIFRHAFESVRLAIRWKTDPASALKTPMQLWRAPLIGLHMRPKFTGRSRHLTKECQLSDLPHITCWPKDGGPFVTLPQVMSCAPDSRSLASINLGMYRVQLAGNDYGEHECGLHYQIHRGIGIHHAQAMELHQSLPVNVTVGGTPAMTLAAVMPLPEGMSELTFAGALAGHRIPLYRQGQSLPLYADADFAIVGHVVPGLLKPEGPFGDHLGYYAKTHDFPVLHVSHVYHRPDAVWPMTVVGRPPQEDTTFGELIHELTEPVLPTVLPGVKQVNAVDAAGVHPLLLAVGSERYTPYDKPGRPQELLTQASAILGQGQLSLAKYLWIIDGGQPAAPAASQIAEFFEFALSRIDWRRDLHFQTRTTIDTLDYTGDGLNQGSKLVIAAGGQPIRQLPRSVSFGSELPDQWSRPELALPGVLVVQGSSYVSADSQAQFRTLCDRLPSEHGLNQYPLIVLVDDSNFAARNISNFVWSTFTRSNPAADVYGIGSFIENKHFGCTGSLVIDARKKPHHAPELIDDPLVSAKVDARAARQDELARFL
ncbi:MAG: UbiD family decarboxylase [Planctomycetales bacterium]|nr:UbiD family decarboxylase [Planctomycetales bacterium]